MRKCSLCKNQYPAGMLVKMVQIIGQKAYLHSVCPACRVTALNNPHYYVVVEEKNQ